MSMSRMNATMPEKMNPARDIIRAQITITAASETRRGVEWRPSRTLDVSAPGRMKLPMIKMMEHAIIAVAMEKGKTDPIGDNCRDSRITHAPKAMKSAATIIPE